MKSILKYIAFSMVGLWAVTSVHAITITSDFTGAWFQPATVGQGIQLQVLSNGSAGAFWFTFDGNGNQVWALGTGQITGDTLVMEMRTSRGPVFGPNFDPSALQQVPFGTVTMQFDNCENGTLSWTSSDPQFGVGNMPIQRLTSSGDSRCTGSISDNTRQGDPLLDFRVFLDNLGIFPDAQAHADYRQTATRTDFDVELEDLPVDSYTLLVDGVQRGVIEVVTTDFGTRGEIEFSSPQDDNELLLDFDPLGGLVEIAQGDTLIFSGILDPDNAGGGNGGGNGGGSNGAPPFGNSETEVELINTGLDPDASGDVELEQRPDRVEFDVEIEDLDLGIYELWVAGEMRAEIEVIEILGGTEGEVEFRNPVEPGKLPLDFDPIGQPISIEQAGNVFLEVMFPTELGGGDDDNGGPGDDDDDDDNGGSGNGDELEIDVDLTNTGADADASGDAKWEQRTDRTDFSVEAEDLDEGTYNLIVNGVVEAQIEVVAVDGGTEGEVEFRDPPEAGKLPLNFDPRGQLIEIEQGGTIFLMTDFPTEPGNSNGGPGDDDDDDDDNGSPGDDDDDDNGGSGNGDELEIDVDLTNTGADADASGDAKWEQRTDRTDFSVEAEDLDEGTYNLIVNGVVEAQIEVVAVDGGTEGEVEFRDPPEAGKLPLNFDPRGQLIEVEQDGVVYLMVDFPAEP